MPSETTENHYSTLNDEQLAELCRKQDDLAFQELMTRYVQPILNFARQYSKATEDAEDITQDTFLKVWKNIKYYTKGRTFRPWLYAIARNTALDQIKKKKALPFSDLDDKENDLSFADTIEDHEPLPPQLFEKKFLTDKLSEVLKVVHPDHRAVLILHYHEELTFDEIASIVGKPMNTVKSWHRRALIKLREELAHHID